MPEFNENKINPMDREIVAKIAPAIRNPMLQSRFLELKNELSSLENEIETDEIKKKKAEILWTMMKSGVRTDNITEYRETLLHIARKCGFDLKWSENTFQNKTSHANKREENEGEILEFLTVFIKDDKGELIKPESIDARKSDLDLANNS
ncbi:MAG: hypothetical protein KBD52_01485 [Candidatus Pacebacteria bacterium]|nr:hypothetical protein [Candidatus Paceibacterota bacterium]